MGKGSIKMNCKKGDLAIIIKSVNPDNLGKIVSIERYYGKSPSVEGRLEYGITWKNNPNLDLWVVVATTTIFSDNNKFAFDELPYPDAWLLPVSDIEDNFAVEEKEIAVHK
jgi:hypothetical protein